MADISVLVLLGSLRAASVNRQLAELAVETAPNGVHLQLFDRLGELPFYNEDVDHAPGQGALPEPVTALRGAAAQADAALIVTPEYNGSIPAVLKNAIDWLSRPYRAGALRDKPVAVIGAALGQYGGVWAHDEARKSFRVAGTQVIDSIKLSIPSATLQGRHPRQNVDVVEDVREVVGKLAAEVA